MAMQNIKYVVFVAVLVFVVILSYLFFANMDLLVQNAFWVVLLAVFLFAAWKWSFLLKLKDYERAVIMRFGKVSRVGGPGWTFVVPGIEEPVVVDLRTQTIDVPKQDVISKENIELKIDAVVYLRVKSDSQSVINSVVEIDDYKEAVKLYVVSAIRNVVGNLTLSEIIASTERLETKLKAAATEISSNWGVEIVSVDFKDVDMPKAVLDAMHDRKAAEQRKLARSESAQAHMIEIAAVRDAAKNLGDKALAYYYIRALEKLGQGQATKIIFPMELSKLATAVSGNVSGKSDKDVEALFKKYAPVVKAMINSSGKKKTEHKAKGKK